jgi:hypothetical protein
MKRASIAAVPLGGQIFLALIAATGLLFMSGSASAQTGNLIAVEEDWELVLTEPHPDTVAPQVTTTMSPYGNLNSHYWTFEINHQSVPSFSPGGLHLHQWNGETRQSTFSRSDRSVITTANDTITWTQSLRCTSGRLKFEVENGNSGTWGIFGFGSFELDTLWLIGQINGYSPDVSVANAGIGFASNRVQSLKLKCVRSTYSNGQTVTDNTVRVIFEQQE